MTLFVFLGIANRPLGCLHRVVGSYGLVVVTNKILSTMLDSL